MDVFQLLRIASEEVIPWSEVKSTLAELIGDLKKLALRDKVRLAALIKDGTVADVLDDGVQSLQAFHIPAALDIRPSGVEIERVELLFFYGNRVSSYPLDSRDILGRASV